MKKLLAFAMLAVTAFSVSACNVNTPNDEGDKILDYSQIYRRTPEKSAEISGKSLYKASYGYTQSFVQGYNGFYYEYAENGATNRMTLSGEVWKGSAAEINGGIMKSTSSVKAVRSFVSPVSGAAKISGNPSLVSGSEGIVEVYCGSEKLFERVITDDIGVWHENYVNLAAGQTVKFVVSGDAEVYWNPSIDFSGKGEESLHHAADGYYGDVHPFYDEKSGQLYMFYLSTGNQTSDKTETFGSLLTTSTDFISYRDTKISVDKNNPPEQDLYFALGVYKDKDGVYRSSYGKGNYAGASKSYDLLNWQNGSEMYVDPADGMLKYKYRAYFDTGVHSGRDPDIFYDKDGDKIYCVVMNYYSERTDKGEKGLALYTANSDGIFSTKAVKLLDFTGRGDPECPQLKKIGDRWYLFYSVYGTGTAGGVGRLSYRVAGAGVSPENAEWGKLKEYSLDGGDLHAAQLCEVGGRYYMYGWIGSRPNANVWGGNLNLAREVYVKADGTLGTRCDEYLTKLLNKGRIAKLSFGSSVTSGRSMILAHVDLSGDYAAVELASGNARYYAGIIKRNGKTYLFVNDSLTGSEREVEIEGDKTSFDLKIIADGAFIEAFADDEYSVTAHTTLADSYEISLSGASFKDAEVCRLADGTNIFD